MSKRSEDGSTSMFGVVLMGGFLSVAAIMANLQRISNKNKETSQRLSSSNAFIANLSAISKLHARLDFVGGTAPELRIVNNLIQGQSSPSLVVLDGHATAIQNDISQAGSENPQAFFSGQELAGTPVKTSLEIIETKDEPDRTYFVVKALTRLGSKWGGNNVETVGTIHVRKASNLAPLPTPGPCTGKEFWGYCYYVTANWITPNATCQEKGLVYDADGSEYLTLSDARCTAVLDAYAMPNPSPMQHTFPDGSWNGLGCKYYPSNDWLNGRWNETDSNPNSGGGYRAVACKNIDP